MTKVEEADSANREYPKLGHPDSTPSRFRTPKSRTDPHIHFEIQPVGRGENNMTGTQFHLPEGEDR